MFFLSPADVRNTSFMNWSYSEDGREMISGYIFPHLNAQNEFQAKGKSDYFMGSDFTYDDLGDRRPAEDVHKLVREESINGIACYVVESTPRDDEYMYSKTITWIDKEKWIGVKKEFYDEDGNHLENTCRKENRKLVTTG